MAELDPGVEADLSLFRYALDVAADGVAITDATRDDHPVVWCNPAFERLTGYRAPEVIGRNLRFLQGADRDQPERAKLRRAIADGLPCCVVVRNYRKDGSLFLNEISLTPVRDRSGRVAKWVGFHRDSSARIRLERTLQEREAKLVETQELLERLTTRDGLTGLVSRPTFLETLAREWKRAARERTPLSLLAIDVDSFRAFNEAHGPAAADACLQRVARGLEEILKRPADLLARSGGDELVALLPATDAAGARILAEAMRERIRGLAIDRGSPPGVVTVSIGSATEAPPGEPGADAILLRAGAALHRARELGGDRVESWTAEPIAAPA